MLAEDEDGQAALDTLSTLQGITDQNAARDYLKRYQRILGNQNRWESFFAVRKKVNEFFLRTFPVLDHYLGIELRFDRTLFPKPGHEAEISSPIGAEGENREEEIHEVSKNAWRRLPLVHKV